MSLAGLRRGTYVQTPLRSSPGTSPVGQQPPSWQTLAHEQRTKCRTMLGGDLVKNRPIFLVGGIPTPLKNDGIRQLGLLFPIYEKNKIHVPNHQPEFLRTF